MPEPTDRPAKFVARVELTIVRQVEFEADKNFSETQLEEIAKEEAKRQYGSRADIVRVVEINPFWTWREF